MSESAPKSIWIIPAAAVQLPDGSTLIKPGKAVQRATVSRTVKLTGVQSRTLAALADCGLIRRERPSPRQAFYYPAEVEDLLRRTSEDPDFWNQVRTKAFLAGSNLRNSNPR